MRSILFTALFPAFLLGALTVMATPDSASAHEDHDCALDFKVKNIDGETVDLEEYEGKVVLAVNVASRCGNTKQYAGLQEMYEKYKGKGLVVIGFPCNQFGGQEPGTEADIKQFCSSKYDVTFPMMSKVNVNGDDASPFYKKLTSTKLDPVGEGKVSWNFEKFLIGRDGQPVARFSPRTKPESGDLTKAIEAELAK